MKSSNSGIENSQDKPQIYNKSWVQLKKLLVPGESLSQRVIRGGAWIFALRFVICGFSLIRTIVLARLLAPNDFGLYGIALLSLSALEMFSQTGFNAALIQKKEKTESYLNIAWTVQVIRGFIIAMLLFIGGPLIANFFNEPRATVIVWIVGVTVLVRGFMNISIIYFQKELKFHKQFAYEFSGILTDLVVTVILALIYRNTLALVFGFLAGSLVRLIVSYVIHPYIPRVSLDWGKFKELFKFGRWMFGSAILGFLTVQGDDVFLGKVLGATTLGLYMVSFRFSNFTVTEIAKVVGQVVFPAYSKLQDNVPKLREGFLMTLEFIAFLSLPITAGILLLAPDFVRLFLGERWMPIVPVMQVLVISGLFRSLIDVCGKLCMGVGQPSIDFWTKLVRVGIMASLIYPLTITFGMVGTALAVLFGIIAVTPLLYREVCRILKVEYKEVIKTLLPSLIGSGIMSLVVFTVKNSIGQIGIVGFVNMLLIGIGTYAIFLYFLWYRFQCGPIKSVQWLRRSL